MYGAVFQAVQYQQLQLPGDFSRSVLACKEQLPCLKALIKAFSCVLHDEMFEVSSLCKSMQVF